MKRCNPCPNPNEICSCILHPEYHRFKQPGVELIKSIIKEETDRHNISIDILLSNSRAQEICRIRKIAMKRCRNETSSSLKTIAALFNRSHSSVLYQLNK